MGNAPDIHRSVDSSKFEGLGKRYFNYWGDDSLHLGSDEHRDIRIALCRVLKETPTDGAIVFCGTGPNIARNRDLDSTLVGGHLEDHQELVFTDFSQDMLVQSERTIRDISTTVATKSHLAIRDYSRNNLSAKFDTLLSERISNIKNVKGMNEFIKYIEDVGVKEVQTQKLPHENRNIDHRLIAKPDTQEGLQFDKILHKRIPVRLVVANLLITGMFAVTEMDFRRKVDWLRKKFPTQVTDEMVVEWLTTWHKLLLSLNNKVGGEFVEDALSANEELGEKPPAIFLSADDTVTYTGLDKFERINMKKVGSKLPKDVAIREIDSTIWNHSHEEIPHKHTVSVALVDQK